MARARPTANAVTGTSPLAGFRSADATPLCLLTNARVFDRSRATRLASSECGRKSWCETAIGFLDHTYEILGVPPSISDEDLKHAFHDLCTHYHPDTLQSLDLPTDLSNFANSRLIRIIDSYRRIKTMRHKALGNGHDKNSSAEPLFTRV